MRKSRKWNGALWQGDDLAGDDAGHSLVERFIAEHPHDGWTLSVYDTLSKGSAEGAEVAMPPVRGEPRPRRERGTQHPRRGFAHIERERYRRACGNRGLGCERFWSRHKTRPPNGEEGYLRRRKNPLDSSMGSVKFIGENPLSESYVIGMRCTRGRIDLPGTYRDAGGKLVPTSAAPSLEL